ncbi:hypothetical protein [Bacillus sp. OV166]|uniref:hypothetical protein n=1 Tax=Bacillus sp. OV166 TaxID=1882763 RepID=UPI000B43B802|nr:hypothetical protein [Bacillus sp. OV166]
MKTQAMSISQFLNREKEPISIKVERHFKKYGLVYKVAGVTLILLTGMGGDVFAAGSIDVEANKLYKEVIGVGKWIIVFKGGIDTIKSVGNGDFDSAKKSFFGYLLTYLFLLALPYGMDKIGGIFDHLNTVPTSSSGGWE